MRKFAGTLSVLLITSVLLSGCFAQKYVAGSLDQQAKMSGAAAETQQYDVIKSFSVTDRSGWFVFGLIPVAHTDVQEIVDQEVKSVGGDAVINLTVESKYDFVDVLIGILVGGIYNSRVSYISGDVIKYQ